MRKLVLTLTALALVSASAAFAALPGPHRALLPSAYGLSKLAPGLYTDAPERGDEIRQLSAGSHQRMEAYFGKMQVTPRIIVCTRQACADTFDLRPRGLTYGAHLVLIGPEGVNGQIFDHELSHVHLHGRMGLRDVRAPRIPAWFDEGLATHLSGATNFESYTPAQARWIMRAQSFRDWGRLHGAHHWRETYGAARVLVEDLHMRLGQDGILELIEVSLETGDFDNALVQRVGPNWP